jgi:Carboxypeptidase regulatory-like domain
MGRDMRRSRVLLGLLLAMSLLASLPLQSKDKNATPGRLLVGKVLNRDDNVLPDAVVYVTDTRTHAVKTYIVGNDGMYRFPALAANVDYEVYAQFQGKTSDTKRVSQFDDRKLVNLDLKIDSK